MKLNPNDPQVRSAVFGKEVENFLRSELGDYLLTRAKDKKEQAVEKMKSVNPFDPEEVVRVTNEIRIADMFMDWLAEAIQMGREAQENLEIQ